MGVYFLCQATGQLLVTGNETENIQWLPVEQIAQRAKEERGKFDWVDQAGICFYLRSKSLE